MNIGERIKKRRKEIGLSVDDVADKLNKNRATVYRYESNDIEKLPLNILEPLANVLQTTPAYLMGWDTKKNSEITVVNNENTSTMETIANRIKQGLAMRNMKQADLVEKTKIGKSSISTYISGAYEPKQRNIYKIAQALDVNEAWLMGHDVPMERENNISTLNNNFNNKENLILNNFNKLNDLGKLEAIKRVEELTYINKYIEADTKVIELPKKEKQIWEEPGKEHLMPVACHDDNLTEEERAIVNKKINEILDNLDKY